MKSKEQKIIKKNVNSHNSVIHLLRDFFHAYSKESVDKYFEKYPQQLKANNFIKKEFPIATENSEHFSIKNKSFFKIMESDKNNFLINTGIVVENENSYLTETYHFKNGQGESVNDTIDIAELLKIDFKKIFYSQPSQVALGRVEGDMSISNDMADEIQEEIPKVESKLLVLDSKSDSAMKFLTRKTVRDSKHEFNVAEREERTQLLLEE
jgi:hypothetical protein